VQEGAHYVQDPCMQIKIFFPGIILCKDHVNSKHSIYIGRYRACCNLIESTWYGYSIMILLQDLVDPLQQPCSETNLAHIAKQLNRWEPVYMHLGVTGPEAEAIKKNHPHDYEHQKFQVLYQWKVNKGQFQGTFKAIVDVFTELGDQQMVDTIRTVAAEANKGIVNTCSYTD